MGEYIRHYKECACDRCRQKIELRCIDCEDCKPIFESLPKGWNYIKFQIDGDLAAPLLCPDCWNKFGKFMLSFMNEVAP